MDLASEEYQGHRIVLRVGGADAKLFRDSEDVVPPELLIDDEPIVYGQLPDGQYFLREFAYEWRYDLMSLARALIEYRTNSEAAGIRSPSGDSDSAEGGRDGNP